MKQLALLLMVFSQTGLLSQEVNHDVDTIRIMSDILHENRSIIIYNLHHTSVNDTANFIYLIDGEDAGYRVQQLMDQFGDSLSNWIVVGIVNTDRRRDLLYVNGAAQFLDFITQELISEVEKDYKINKRILYGHSFGGSFTVYAMLRNPGIFNGYIASSPTPIMDLIQKESYLQLESTSKNILSFFFSCGSRDMKQVRKWSQTLSDNLSGITFNKLDWKYWVFEGKDHYNSDVAALVNGLRGLK